MKNQYIGDIQDYRKYGLLRILEKVGFGHILLALMTTPDDLSSNDGKKRRYLDLDQTSKRVRYDSFLYRRLQTINSDDEAGKIDKLKSYGLLKKATFFHVPVPEPIRIEEKPYERLIWLEKLKEAARPADLVFFDPDNGIEVLSAPMTRVKSIKYVYWNEIEEIWRRGKSVLIYQHFPRRKRVQYIHDITSELSRHTDYAIVTAYRTPDVLFLLATQDRHEQLIPEVDRMVEEWGKQLYKDISIKAVKENLPEGMHPMPWSHKTHCVTWEYSNEELEKIERGYTASCMEEKWNIFVQDSTIRFHRSWTGFCVYLVHLIKSEECYKASCVEINRDPKQYTETDDVFDLALVSFLIESLLLGKKVEFPQKDQSPEEAAIKQWSIIGREMLEKEST
jgi:hypothetical protein